MASIDEVMRGPPLRKLLFMTRAEVVDGHLKPHWRAALEGTEAETMQAVPDMLGGWAGGRQAGCWCLLGEWGGCMGLSTHQICRCLLL